MSVKSIENGNLNLNNLDVSTINGSVYPPVSVAGTLSAVLTAGNSAGLTSINMNGQDITGVDDIALTTINGSAYPPVVSTPNLTSVLTAGAAAGNLSITGVNDIGLTTINGSAYPPVVSTPNLTSVLTAGAAAGNLSITGVNDIGLTTINGSAYPPVVSTPNLTAVLTAGSAAGNLSITGVNDIALTTINGSAYPPTTSTSNLSAVLTAGNDAAGQSITDLSAINNISGTAQYDTSSTFTKVIPSIPANATAVVPSFEFIQYNLTGKSNQVSQTINLVNNIYSTTDYAVFPSYYYGYTGSSGTYDLEETLGAIETQMIISNITNTSFVFNVNKSTGDNINIIVCFLVVYKAAGTEFSKSYS
jgi:hypothetical protein